MPWTDDGKRHPQRPPEELLGLVRQRASAARQRQRAWISGTLGVVAVMVTIAFMALPDGGRGTRIRTAAPPTVPATSTAATAWEYASEPTAMAGPISPTSRPSPSVTVRPTATTRLPSTTTLGCRNEQTNPACGEFRWDPAPGPNQPMSVSVTFTPGQPKVGEVVTFRAVAEDPDAKIWEGANRIIDFGDANNPQELSTHGDCFEGYGPWTPPPPRPDRLETTLQHTYSAAGTFNVTFGFQSSGPCPDTGLYASRGQASVTVVVSSSS